MVSAADVITESKNYGIKAKEIFDDWALIEERGRFIFMNLRRIRGAKTLRNYFKIIKEREINEVDDFCEERKKTLYHIKKDKFLVVPYWYQHSLFLSDSDGNEERFRLMRELAKENEALKAYFSGIEEYKFIAERIGENIFLSIRLSDGMIVRNFYYDGNEEIIRKWIIREKDRSWATEISNYVFYDLEEARKVIIDETKLGRSLYFENFSEIRNVENYVRKIKKRANEYNGSDISVNFDYINEGFENCYFVRLSFRSYNDFKNFREEIKKR